LNQRYQAAKADANARGADKAVSDFESAIADSVAVMTRHLLEVQRLSLSDNELYATYYQLIEAGVKVPKGEKWDPLRAVADSALFPNYKQHIRFAALALNEIGLSNYGDCSIVFRTDMIAHRASVFEENSVLFMKNKNILMSDADKLPQGYRATWQDRGKLCVAKLAGSIDPATQPDKYFEVLLRQGAKSEDDEFVEVHIWGPVTARTIEQVTLTVKKKTPRSIYKALKEKLVKAGVTLKEK